MSLVVILKYCASSISTQVLHYVFIPKLYFPISFSCPPLLNSLSSKQTFNYLSNLSTHRLYIRHRGCRDALKSHSVYQRIFAIPICMTMMANTLEEYIKMEVYPIHVSTTYAQSSFAFQPQM